MGSTEKYKVVLMRIKWLSKQLSKKLITNSNLLKMILTVMIVMMMTYLHMTCPVKTKHLFIT